MQLLVERYVMGEDYTHGRMKINDEYFCETLEDKDRNLHKTDPIEEINETKIYGRTAIPRGTYEVKMEMSPHFQRELPHILNVPGWEGVLIHSGNTDSDTFGCILCGEKDDESFDMIINSRVTSDKLNKILSELPKEEYVELIIQ